MSKHVIFFSAYLYYMYLDQINARYEFEGIIRS